MPKRVASFHRSKYRAFPAADVFSVLAAGGHAGTDATDGVSKTATAVRSRHYMPRPPNTSSLSPSAVLHISLCSQVFRSPNPA